MLVMMLMEWDKVQQGLVGNSTLNDDACCLTLFFELPQMAQKFS
jgi:hypothetical protein